MSSQAIARAPRVLTVNAFVRNHFVHLITVTAVLAFLTPGFSSAARAHKLAHGQIDASGMSLFLMMLSAAIQCSFTALRRVVAKPKPLALSLVQLFVTLPF